MKKKITYLLLIISILFSFSGCNNSNDTKYTVWTFSQDYEDFKTSTGATLGINEWYKHEYTSDEWEQVKVEFSSNGKNNMTLGEIQNWLIGKGFDDVRSVNAARWLVDISHGCIVFRNSNFCYWVVK